MSNKFPADAARASPGPYWENQFSAPPPHAGFDGAAEDTREISYIKDLISLLNF